MTTVVVNWSGGPDSTATLQYLLAHTDYEIIALYVNGDISTEMANRMEEQAVDRMYPVLVERYRHFELKKVRHIRSKEFALFCAEGNMYPLLFTLDGSPVKLFIGRCKEELSAPDHVRQFWEKQKRIFDAANLELIELNAHVPKREIRRQLGDLWSMTFSCYDPNDDGSACGKCSKCKARMKAQWRRRY